MSPTDSRPCPSCGAPVAGRLLVCPYCGAKVEDPATTELLTEAAEALVLAVDNNLRSYFPPWSLSLGVGAVALAVGSYVFGRHLGWSVWLAGLAAAALAFFGLALAGSTTERAEARLFQRSIKPRIVSFCSDRGMSRERFIGIARRTLAGRSGGLTSYLDDLLED